jgi:hypothetical protein
MLISVLAVSSGNSATWREQENTSSRTVDNDNSFNKATTLTNNTIFSGVVDPTDDEFDYYKIYLNGNPSTGDYITINYSFDYYFDMGYIDVFNPEYYYILDDLYWPFFDGDYRRSFCACTSGFYYIRIGAYLGETNYNLTVTYYPMNRVTDDDNDINNGTTAVSGGSYIGTINTTYDYIDVYNIDLVSGTETTQALTVELEYYDEQYLGVYNPDNTRRDISDITIGSSTTKEVVKFAADQTGTYHIVVGVSSFSDVTVNYVLNTTIIPNVPADNDYDTDHALLVFNGTFLNSSFNSEFDEFDYYMIDLNQDDTLTVSLLYLDGTGTTDIDIYDSDGVWVNDEDMFDSEKGCWATAIASELGRYYIEVENWWTYRGNYTILFSTGGDHLWTMDEPMMMNITNLDFSMDEDTVDTSHVNLYDIFYDPDSPIEFNSPSHPTGIGENIDNGIWANGTVKFMPHLDFSGTEVVEFKATDFSSKILTWSVKVTVNPVNDPPQIIKVGNVTVTNNIANINATQDEELYLELFIHDPDNTGYIDYLTNISHNEPADLDFKWTPSDIDAFNVYEKANNAFISFIPDNSMVGSYEIKLMVSDSIWWKPYEHSEPEKKELSNNTIFLEFNVANINDPPEFISIGGESAFPDGVVSLNADEDTWNNYLQISTKMLE